MTRITFGVYRAGVREGGLTLASYADRWVPPTPFPSASAAVVRYHREGGEAAWRALDRSLGSSSYWGARGTPQAGWADAIRQCFQVYRSMADGDARPAFATGLNRDLSFPPDELGVYIDVVLLDPDGYVPRLVLWSTDEVTLARAQLYAAPAWRVLEDELGQGRVPSVEVWHLRSGTPHYVAADQAAAAVDDVERIVHRLAAPGP
jgi:hypothetical protein